jgi:ATP-dependent helicase/nuclease subunit B
VGDARRRGAPAARRGGGAGLRFRQVAAICRDAGSELLFDDAARWEALAAVQERYAAILAEIGRSDRELARLEALRTEREMAFRGDLWLVGIAEMPRIVRRLLRSSGVAIHVLVHAPEGEAGAFDELGCLRVEAWTGRRLEIPEDRIRIADRPADQADAAVAEIARLGDRYATDDVVIAVPDAELVPYLEQRLEGREVPARYAGGRPADRFAPHRLLAALADYLSGRRWDAFAALIRHPDLAAWLARATGQGRPRSSAPPTGGSGSGFQRPSPVWTGAGRVRRPASPASSPRWRRETKAC